jgi:hypothetical protein
VKAPDFAFRNDGRSGHGAGRIRYFVDLGDRCIGSVEGKTGDFRIEGNYPVTDGERAPKDSGRYHTRVDAARALAELSARAESPPVSAAEYRILQRCKHSDSFVMPMLGLARILCSRGLLTQKRGTSEFRTTTKGVETLQRYEDWASQQRAHNAKAGV